MYDSKLIMGKLNRWGNFIKRFSLPEYNEIPNLGLYMDQVLQLMGQYLAPLSHTTDAENPEDNTITASAINNYVRMKVMPAPEKKKYQRVHLMYLIIICTLKQSMSISDIQKLIPSDLSEEKMKVLYEAYLRCFKASALFFVNEVKDETERILATGRQLLDEADSDENMRTMGQKEFDYAVQKLIFSSCTIASFSQLLTSKLTGLDNVPFSEDLVKDREV